jgi:hypothetical protein
VDWRSKDARYIVCKVAGGPPLIYPSAQMTKRKILKSIPEWFHLDRYNRCGQLDYAGWFTQISIRRVSFSQLRDMKAPYDGTRILPEWDEPVMRALASIRESPICDTGSGPFNKKPFTGYDARSSVVRSMTLQDLYKIERKVRLTLTPEQIQYARKLTEDASPSGILRFLYCREWMYGTIDGECISIGPLPVMIDLSFPNRVLITHFEKHLRRLRTISGGRPREAAHKFPDLKRWSSMGVLACIDLLLWGIERNARIPDRLIADALQSQRYNVEEVDEEKVRKTLRPLALNLVDSFSTGTTYRRLEALATNEMPRADNALKNRHKS